MTKHFGVKKLADINITKGHNIQISGEPSDHVASFEPLNQVAIHPYQFKGVKPKLLVKEGDTVKCGQPIFTSKSNEDITFPSIGGGIISKIEYGERRRIEKILIDLSKDENKETFKSYSMEDIDALSAESALNAMKKGSLFSLIRQRPFNNVADPNRLPRDIFVSGWNTAPLSVDLDIALRGRRSQFQSGIKVLSKLTSGSVHLSYFENTLSETLLDIEDAQSHSLNGPHPAGNVGIQIHHIAPLTSGEFVWIVNAQDVVRIGHFFLTGEFDTRLMIAIGGPSIVNPCHIKSRMGAPIKPYLDDNVKDGENRFISGDVLTGTKITQDDHIGFYDSAISAVPEGGQREFLGMLRPGTSSSRYSLTNAFLGKLTTGYNFNTLKNGSERYMVPINSWEDVLPMDILPNPLYRAILVEDVEEMEQLGIFECDEEDFALCSFACPSKIDLGKTIKQGLQLIESEM